eukprot:1006321-Prorocentrum_minimum.AAC.1
MVNSECTVDGDRRLSRGGVRSTAPRGAREGAMAATLRRMSFKEVIVPHATPPQRSRASPANKPFGWSVGA